MRIHPIFSKLLVLQNFILIQFLCLSLTFYCPTGKGESLWPSWNNFSQAIIFQASDQFDKSLKNSADCVKLQALFHAQNRRWTQFICLMALESVLGLLIHSIYSETSNRHAFCSTNWSIQER